MADRTEFLGRVQTQLSAWSDWVRQWDGVANSRAGDLRQLIEQGKAQWERVSAASEEAWQGIAEGAEHAWSSLQEAAASLAQQNLPAANEAAIAAMDIAPARKAGAKAAARRKATVHSKAKKRVATRKVAAKRASPRKAAKKKARRPGKPASAASARRRTRKPARKK
jgi:hypothetical protein